MGRALAAIGIVLTLGYALFAWWLVGDRIQTLRTMDLNEVGDFLAGAFGPVAILWLVLGFFQQGIELRQGTDALRLQAKELSNSVEQQTELVAAQKASLVNYERSLEPLLKMNVTDAGMDDGGFYVNLEIVNSGGYCDCVEIELSAANSDQRVRDADPLFTDAYCNVRFGELHEWDWFEVVVKYKTRSGRANFQTFTAEHYQDQRGENIYIVRKHSLLT